MASKYEMDMCSGPILSKVLVFSIPLIFSGILQLLFNAADMIVIGNYSSSNALAAIGATSSLINFFVNVIIGISVGSNVVVARYYGAKKDKDVHDAVHTSIALCLILGIAVAIIAFILSKEILIKMGTPKDVIDLATLYIRIYFIGLPATMLYNFGSSILRAIGDTKRPLIFLTISGVINVGLNLFFVIVLGMSVEGVALATIISQAISAFLVLRCLVIANGNYKLTLSEIRISKPIMVKIMQIGLPAGVQGMIFSLSNLLIQSSVNEFGSIAMAGNTACANIEGFVYTAMNAIYQTVLSFVSQNYGAGKYDRIKKIFFRCVILVAIIGIVLGNLGYIFGHQLLNFYSPKERVIEYGLIRMRIIMTFYFSCGVMEVFCGVLRGLGYGVMPMIVSLLGACGFRILWIYTVFKKYHTLDMLYISYPISWVLTTIAHAVCLIVVYELIKRRIRAKNIVQKCEN